MPKPAPMLAHAPRKGVAVVLGSVAASSGLAGGYSTPIGDLAGGSTNHTVAAGTIVQINAQSAINGAVRLMAASAVPGHLMFAHLTALSTNSIAIVDDASNITLVGLAPGKGGIFCFSGANWQALLT